ncbi:hypothetical protein BaRGS_00019157 [Batillaria attramentaria]|uniref:Uncharacterized protein n=1 Tax=Batillaria attramentaria TaxID=370345 RepID=A0ABD0KRH7_9CAEN
MAVTALEMENIDLTTTPRLLPSYRLLMACLTLWALSSSSWSQTTLGAAMACMLKTSNTSKGDFDWDKETQSWIHSSRFIAYYLAQLPSAKAASIFGNRRMAIFGSGLLGLADILSVPCAKISVGLLIGLRVVQGVTNAMLFTSSVNVLGCWTLPEESTLLFGLAGTGLMTLAFCVTWTVFSSDSPDTARWAAARETDYLKSRLLCSHPDHKISWKDMFRSCPVYAIGMAQIANDWLSFLFMTVFPTFLTEVVQLSYRQTELVCGLPYIAVIPLSAMYGRFSDWLREKEVMSTLNVRRMAQFFATILPAACCILLVVLPLEQAAVVVLVYSVNVASSTAASSGYFANLEDLAPGNSGAIMAASQTLALWTSFVGPIVVDNITVHRTRREWNIILYLTASLQCASFVGYSILASTDAQPWAPAAPLYTAI